MNDDSLAHQIMDAIDGIRAEVWHNRLVDADGLEAQIAHLKEMKLEFQQAVKFPQRCRAGGGIRCNEVDCGDGTPDRIEFWQQQDSKARTRWVSMFEEAIHDIDFWKQELDLQRLWMDAVFWASHNGHPLLAKRLGHAYLMPEQAESIVKRVVSQFKSRTGTNPSRVVIHKSSTFQPEEIDGFLAGCGSAVPSCEMIWMRPTGFRLIRKGNTEVERGMFASVEDEKLYLFTTGYVDWWKEYPGPHVPAPLEIGSPRDTDMVERAKEILALTKMNWNSADGMGRHPITLSFARQVGAIMTEIDDDTDIHPLYRFYM